MYKIRSEFHLKIEWKEWKWTQSFKKKQFWSQSPGVSFCNSHYNTEASAQSSGWQFVVLVTLLAIIDFANAS